MAKKKTKRTDPATMKLPRVGVDSHAHLDMEAFADDLDQVLERAGGAGVARTGNVFMGPRAYEKGRGLFQGRDEVFFLLGIHPHDALECTQETLSDLESIFGSDDRVRALGEIGLDFYRQWSPFQAQREAFQSQLELARDLGLRVVIHSREADEEVVAILTDLGFKDRPLLWHCFGRDLELARVILSMGWTISISGPVTYPRNFDLQRAAEAIPLDRMVLETDCPFLAPEPWRGKRNEPALSVFTAAKIATLKGLPVEEVWRATGEAAMRFFALEDTFEARSSKFEGEEKDIPK